MENQPVELTLLTEQWKVSPCRLQRASWWRLESRDSRPQRYGADIWSPSQVQSKSAASQLSTRLLRPKVLILPNKSCYLKVKSCDTHPKAAGLSKLVRWIRRENTGGWSLATVLFPLVKLESIARESCSLRMSQVGLGSSLVSKGIGVSSSCPRVSSPSSMVDVLGVGVPWEGCFVGAPLLPSRAAGRLVIEGTNLIARGTGEGSLRVQDMQDMFSWNNINDIESSSQHVWFGK